MYTATRNYLTVAKSGNLLITLDEVKEHLRIDPSDTDDDGYLQLLLKAAIRTAEKLTGREIEQKTFQTQLRSWPCCPTEIRRSELISINEVKYKTEPCGDFTQLSSQKYCTILSNVFSKIRFTTSLPSVSPNTEDAIVILFDAGYTDRAKVPDNLVYGILSHVAAMYENRGDCDADTCSSMLPKQSKMAYRLCEIISLRV